MLMIIGLHYFNGTLGGALSHLEPNAPNYYITHFLESLFIVGVGCFVIITGYFQGDKISIRLNRIIELVMTMLFYSIVFYAIAVFAGALPLNPKEIVKVVFPFLVKRRWFVETYIILYLLSPFINIALIKVNKREFKILLCILLLFFSMWPSFLPGGPVTDSGYGIITLVIFYCLGVYLKRFGAPNYSKGYYFALYVACAVITFLFSVFASKWLGRIWGYNFIFNILGSTFLFLFFLKVKVQSARINYIATFAFGVYLIHSDFSLTNILYRRILNVNLFWFSPFFIFHAIGSIVLVYIASTLIDICRKWLFGIVGGVVNPSIKQRIPMLWKKFP